MPGSVAHVKQLKERFIADSKAVTFEEHEIADINIIGSLLKLYLRELPDSLFPKRLHDSFSEAAKISDPEGQRQAFLVAFAHTPDCHLASIRYLFGHLTKIMAS